MKENYKFNQNRNCEYFPCHKIENPEENFSCMFCYCPLYMLGKDCGGNFKYTETGIKDCSNCVLPHMKDSGYNHVMGKISLVIERTKIKIFDK